MVRRSKRSKRKTVKDNPLDALVPNGALGTSLSQEAPAPPVSSEAPMAPVEPAEPVKSVEPVAAPEPENLVEPEEITPAPTKVSVGPAQFLTFFLRGPEYAVSILRIREIFEFDTLTTVPTTPGWIRGVMNLRGSVVPVVDLSVKFGLGETPITNRTCVVIVEVELDGELSIMGALVDAVSRVVELSPDDIEPPPAFGTAVRVDCLEGTGKVEEKFVPILDVDQVLSSDELLTAVVEAPSLAEAARVSGDESASAGASA